jgi:hypothetical protein
MSYGHNKKNKNDLSYFTLNWRINETGQTISQYFNLYIKSTPLAFNNERKNLLRILHACVKENISFAEVEIKLQKRFLSESSSLFVTLEYPD